MTKGDWEVDVEEERRVAWEMGHHESTTVAAQATKETDFTNQQITFGFKKTEYILILLIFCLNL